MARTRGASYHPDGELLDREGKPIPTGRVEAAEYLQAQADQVAAAEAPPSEPVAPAGPIRWRSDAATWERNMEAYEAMRLLDVMLGGVSVELDAEAWGRLPADVRRHFRRVV